MRGRLRRTSLRRSLPPSVNVSSPRSLAIPPYASIAFRHNELKTYPVLILRALRLYVCLLLLRVFEARVLLRELRLVAIGFEQVVDVAS